MLNESTKPNMTRSEYTELESKLKNRYNSWVAIDTVKYYNGYAGIWRISTVQGDKNYRKVYLLELISPYIRAEDGGCFIYQRYFHAQKIAKDFVLWVQSGMEQHFIGIDVKMSMINSDNLKKWVNRE